MEEEVKQEELPLADNAAEPVAEAPETPVEVAAEETPAKTETPDVEKPAEPDKPDWKEKELKAKHRQNQELKRQLAEQTAAREAAEALAAKFNQPTSQNVSVPVDEVEKRAQQLVQQQRYVEDCNKAAQAGEKTFGTDWRAAIENLELKGGFDEQTMRGILATARKHGTEAPAKILYELGKDPNRYDALMAMSYEERIIEMADLVRQPTAKPVSNAPAPVSAVGGKAAPAGAILSDGQTDDQWYAIRRAQRLKKYKESHL